MKRFSEQRLFMKPGDLSLILRAHMVEGGNSLLKVAL